MKLPLNCTVDYIHDFISEEEANELYELLIHHYQIDQSRLVIQAGGKTIATDGFKILFATERLIRLNSHAEDIHGKSFAWSGEKGWKHSSTKNLNWRCVSIIPTGIILRPIIVTN